MLGTEGRALYLDTSVVVSLYIPEARSLAVQDLVQRDLDVAVSDLVDVELVATAAARARTGDLSPEDCRRVVDAFEHHIRIGTYERIDLRPATFALARRLLIDVSVPLRAADALHLALGAVTGRTLLTADRQQAAAAAALHLPFDLIA